MSANAGGRAGTASSHLPSSSDTGRFVAFQTDAGNLLDGDRNGFTDIARADLEKRHPQQRWISRSKFSGPADKPSANPTISDAGEFVLFDTEASDLRPSGSVRRDPFPDRDVYLWNERSGNVSHESHATRTTRTSSAPRRGRPPTSRGNYVAFEAGNAIPDPVTPDSTPAPTPAPAPAPTPTPRPCPLPLILGICPVPTAAADHLRLPRPRRPGRPRLCR